MHTIESKRIYLIKLKDSERPRSMGRLKGSHLLKSNRIREECKVIAQLSNDEVNIMFNNYCEAQIKLLEAQIDQWRLKMK